MNRHTVEMLHDHAVHDAMVRTAFLAALATTILLLHRVLYHFAA